MLERRRAARNYHIVPGEQDDDEEHDIELGHAVAAQQGQESGVIPSSQPLDVTEELDNWDENAEDWDQDDPTDQRDGQDQKTPVSPTDEAAESKKRSD